MKLGDLVMQTKTAALATLHHGEPAVSMVPYAVLPDGTAVLIHVSQLASHTQDMQAHPTVGLLMTATSEAASTVLALPRVSVQGVARVCLPTSPDYAATRQTYLSRFPESEELFGFGDFSLYAVQIQSARFVAGFGRAISLDADQFAQLMQDR